MRCVARALCMGIRQHRLLRARDSLVKAVSVDYSPGTNAAADRTKVKHRLSLYVPALLRFAGGDPVRRIAELKR